MTKKEIKKGDKVWFITKDDELLVGIVQKKSLSNWFGLVSPHDVYYTITSVDETYRILNNTFLKKEDAKNAFISILIDKLQNLENRTDEIENMIKNVKEL